MKKNLIIALVAGVAATASAAYFIIKRKRKLANDNTQDQPVYHEKTHHLTDAFSKAKKHAMHLN